MVTTFIDGQALSATQLNAAFTGKLDANGDATSLTSFAAGGITARTLQNRFADTINVLDFLSNPPDGSSDNTAQLQAAINAGTNKARVYFPPQAFQYSVNSLTVNSNSHIIVDGNILQRANSTGSIFKLANNAINVVIEGTGTLDGQRATQSAARYGVETAGGSGIILLNLTIQNCFIGPFLFSNTANVLIDGVIAKNNNNSAQITSGSSNTWLRNCLITTSNAEGVMYYGGVASSGMTNCLVTSNGGQGVLVWHDSTIGAACHDILLANNIIYSNAKWGISIDKGAGAVASHNAIIIEGNKLFSNNTSNTSTGGVNNNTGTNVQINANQISKNGAGALASYSIRVASGNTQIMNNMLVNEGQGSVLGTGILLVSTANNVMVSGNMLVDDQAVKTMKYGVDGTCGTGVSFVNNQYLGMISANNNAVPNTDTVESDTINLQNVTITSGTINGTAIGGTVAAPGTFTNLVATNQAIAPTRSAGDNSNSVATTAFVAAAMAAAGTYNPAAVAITGGTIDGTAIGGTTPSSGAFSALTAPTRTAGDSTTNVATTAFVNTSFAKLASPTFTGTPAAPTATAGTATTQIATTAFVDTSFAKLASPTFTGTPAAPTATAGTNTTQLATTAFVTAAVVAGGAYNPSSVAITGGTINGTSIGGTTPSTGAFSTLTAPTQTAGDSSINVATTAFVNTSFAKLASPTFTGTPAAPTATAGTATTQIATTAFVDTSFAKLASPTFTGTPAAPTAAPGNNTTQLATTAFVSAAVAAGGSYNPAAVAITGGTINGTSIGATSPNTGAFSSLSNTGSEIQGVRVFTAAGNTTMSATDRIIVVKKASGAATQVTLVSSPATGRRVTIKDGKGDSGINPITIVPAAGTIDGAANFIIDLNYASVDLFYDGTIWSII